MKTHEFDAIGTHWWLEILSDQIITPGLIESLAATAAQFDQRYSRFRDDSLVSELYRTGRLSRPPAEMLRMFEFAREMYEVSDGAFDMTVGNALHRFGYGKRSIAKDVDVTRFWQQIAVSPIEIRYPHGVMLDFGGFGKGWLIDQFVRDLKLAGISEFIINGGGDLYVESKKPVRFALEDPYDNVKLVGSVDIARGALAGSNSLKRIWQDGTEQKHHIIDPKTNDSSQTDVVASFVVASTALIADTMATIFILRPELEEILSRRYDLKTVLIRKETS